MLGFSTSIKDIPNNDNRKDITMKLHAKTGIAMGALLALAVPTAQASTGINSGFYAGASVGLSNLSGSQSFRAMELPDIPRDQRKMGISAQSLGVGLFGGYGHKWDCLWLGTELSYLFDQLTDQKAAQFQVFGQEKIFKTRSTGAFGAAVHIGYIHHSNCLVYGILGLEGRRFQVNFQDPVGDAVPVSAKYSSLAFAPGLGVRVKLTNNISVRGEYKYAFYRSKTAEATGDIGGVANTSRLKVMPRVQAFQVGVVYSF